MSAQSSSDVETKALLEGISNVNSNRASPSYGLATNAQENAESLRASLLEGFKAVNAIHNASLAKDKKSVTKSITRLFNRNNTSTIVQQAAAIQEAFAYMHRELTNVLAATGKDRNNLSDAVIDQKVAEIIQKGTEKLPKGTLQKDLKTHMDIFQDKAKECLASKAPTVRQQNR